LLSLPVKYPNREKQDKKLLTYTSLPIENNLEITGHPIIKLYMTSTHEDGAVLAYFEFIDQKGKIHYITDGQLRLIHRKISSDKPPYHQIGPYHSFKKEDYTPLQPGNITDITFALYPTSILLPKGSRIRIAIGGADKDSFARYPEKGNPIISIARNKNYASYLEIPIIKNSFN
jgi:putative CocE/NonD family hydrolase